MVPAPPTTCAGRILRAGSAARRLAGGSKLRRWRRGAAAVLIPGSRIYEVGRKAGPLAKSGSLRRPANPRRMRSCAFCRIAGRGLPAGARGCPVWPSGGAAGRPHGPFGRGGPGVFAGRFCRRGRPTERADPSGRIAAVATILMIGSASQHGSHPPAGVCPGRSDARHVFAGLRIAISAGSAFWPGADSCRPATFWWG